MGRGEQSTATGLSQPRMTKARKQLASSRARPAVIADAKDGSGFSTFSNPPAVAASAAPESDGAQGLRERFVGWNPFDPKAWPKVSESSKLDKFENLKHGMDTGAFVFQSGMETSSSSNTQRIGENPSKLEHVNYDSQPIVRNLEPETIVVDHDRSRCAAADGMFTFGNRLKENVNSDQNTPLIGTNLDNFASSKFENFRFVYGVGSSLNLRPRNKPHNLDPFRSVSGGKKSFKLHLVTPESSKPSDLDFCGFHTEASRSATFVPEVINNFRRDDPDELLNKTSSVVDKTQMDFHSSGLSKSDTMSSNKSQNPEVPIISSSPPTKLESTFIFGASSMNKSESKGSISVNSMKALDNRSNGKSGIYNDKFPSLFSSRMQISSNSNESSFNASDDPSFSSLHDEMEKLNLQNYENSIAYQRKSQTEENVKHNSVNAFIFGNNNSAATSLCDNMEKLNLQKSGDHIASQTKNQTDESVKHNSANPFLFDNDMAAPISSGDSAVNALAKETDKMTIQSPVDALSEKINKVSIHSMLASQSGEAVFNFMSTREQVGMSYMGFRSSRTTADMLKENLVSGPRKSTSFGGKKAEAKASRMRKRNGKVNSFILQHQTFAQTFPFTEEAFESKYSDSVNCYSPMDYSPYQENLVPDQSSREDSLLSTSDTPINSEKSINVDESENLISATQHMNITEDDLTHIENLIVLMPEINLTQILIIILQKILFTSLELLILLVNITLLQRKWKMNFSMKVISEKLVSVGHALLLLPVKKV